MGGPWEPGIFEGQPVCLEGGEQGCMVGGGPKRGLEQQGSDTAGGSSLWWPHGDSNRSFCNLRTVNKRAISVGPLSWGQPTTDGEGHVGKQPGGCGHASSQ